MMKHFIPILFCSILITMIAASGCKTDSTVSTASTAQTGTKATATTSSVSTTKSTMSPYSAGISHKPVPALGETTEMTYTFDVVASDFLQGNPGAEDAKAWVEFWWTDPAGSYLTAKQAVQIPVSEVVVSGDTTWEGNYTKTRSLHLKSTIKLPRAGIWQIEGYFTGKGWKTPIKFYSRDFISQDFAADMYSDSFKTSPFAYLGYDYFNYGFLKEKKKTDFLSEQSNPVIMELDISKPPKAGEEVALTCTMASFSDFPNYSMTIDFSHRMADGSTISVPASQLLVKGNYQWQGNLQKAQPAVFTATIKFPENGDWRIHVQRNSQKGIVDNKPGYSDELKLTVSSSKSYYGWKPLTVKPGTSKPRTTPITVTRT